MPIKTQFTQNQLRDYSSLFSRSKVQSWLKSDFNSINHKIKRYDQNWYNFQRGTYMDYLKYVYEILESHYRNEYIIKNSFLNEWLIKEIGRNNAKIFSEFRVGRAVADLVMFNGTSKVFEIKTEFDSEKRLTLQLENYRKAFNEIYVIVPESKLSIYSKYNEEIGIITFNSKTPNNFTVQREAVINNHVDKDTIMHILRTNEYKRLVKKHFGVMPEITSFNQFDICNKLIGSINNSKLNEYFIGIMKNRYQENILSNRYYKELNQISLAMKFNKSDRKKLIEQLKSPLQA